MQLTSNGQFRHICLQWLSTGIWQPAWRVQHPHWEVTLHQMAPDRRDTVCIMLALWTLQVWTSRCYHNRFTALSPGPPGWAGARRELLDFMVQGKINRGRHTVHLDGRHSIQTSNQCTPPPSSIFFTGQMPFLPPNQQRQSTEGN